MDSIQEITDLVTEVNCLNSRVNELKMDINYLLDLSAHRTKYKNVTSENFQFSSLELPYLRECKRILSEELELLKCEKWDLDDTDSGDYK